jgi:hypothetical protein
MSVEPCIDGELIEIAIALIVTTIVIFHVLCDENNKQSTDYFMSEIHKMIFKPFLDIIILCPDDPKNILNKFIHQVNGVGKQKHGLQIINGFGVSHVIFFGCLSFLYPRKRILLFSIGVLWEIYEGICFHNNNMDLFFNLFGILAAAI